MSNEYVWKRAAILPEDDTEYDRFVAGARNARQMREKAVYATEHGLTRTMYDALVTGEKDVLDSSRVSRWGGRLGAPLATVARAFRERRLEQD